jgi:uncharacterized protein (DUF433 family)
MIIKKILREYPGLKKEDILAAIEYAAKMTEFKESELVNIK